jgi:hypothetical protein
MFRLQKGLQDGKGSKAARLEVTDVYEFLEA